MTAERPNMTMNSKMSIGLQSDAAVAGKLSAVRKGHPAAVLLKLVRLMVSSDRSDAILWSSQRDFANSSVPI